MVACPCNHQPQDIARIMYSIGKQRNGMRGYAVEYLYGDQAGIESSRNREDGAKIFARVSVTVVMPAMMVAVIHARDIGDGAAVILSLPCLFKAGKGIEPAPWSK